MSKTRHQSGISTLRLLAWIIGLPLFAGLAGLMSIAIIVLLANDRLPPIDSVIDYRPRLPLQIYSVDRKLIGEYGSERRTFVSFDDAPIAIKQAIMAAEDVRFFEHNGIDFKGVLRAALANFRSGGRGQGASTITMQLAREFFLSKERTYTRKIAEVLLALRIEAALEKEKIFELYLNQIFLGKRAYGFESAAHTYFDKPLSDITVAEAAMLAGLPKAPSRFNPIVNPKRATLRQHYVLGRMLEHRFITQEQHDKARAQELHYKPRGNDIELNAPYVSELARHLVYSRYGAAAYTSGLKVFTTIHSRDQIAAQRAVRKGILAYDFRYDYRGPERQLALSSDTSEALDQIVTAIKRAQNIDGLIPMVVISASKKAVKVVGADMRTLTIRGDGLKLIESTFKKGAAPELKLKTGSLIRIVEQGKHWAITQRPKVQAAFVAANTHDGSIRALVGGFDYQRNKFNRVTQAWRQPGSSFKPFIFSAALEKGFMTSSVINDAPISLIDIHPEDGPRLWEPRNFSGRFDGPMTLRTALARSKNMVSVRVMQRIGAEYARKYIGKFGFDPKRHPPVLTLGLGAGLVTPLQMVSGISVFANGGFQVDPYLISHITDAKGNIIANARPRVSGLEENRVIDARNAYIIDSMLKEVVRRGTARRLRALKREDLAGKTGTTNNSYDAWFVGYQPTIAATAWVGFDNPTELGVRETGGGLALPIWLEYMKSALKDVPLARQYPPPGVVQIDGEIYLAETTPDTGIRSIGMSEGGISTGTKGRRSAEKIRNEVF